MRKRLAIIVVPVILLLAVTNASGEAPTGWSPVVLPTGEYRATIQAMPIVQRPGRPLHVYGNTVRYRHQRTTGLQTGRPVRRILLGTDTLRR